MTAPETFRFGATVRHRQTGWTGTVERIFRDGIGAGDPGPSYRVRWDRSGASSRVRGRDVRPLDQDQTERQR